MVDPRLRHRSARRRVAGRLGHRPDQRTDLAGAGSGARAPLGDHTGTCEPGRQRRDDLVRARRTARGAARRFRCGVVGHDRDDVGRNTVRQRSRTRRRQLVRPANGAASAPATHDHRDRCSRRGVRSDRRLGRVRAPRRAGIWRRSDPAALDRRRRPPIVAVADRVVVADRREPVRHPARLDERDAGVPVGRQGDGRPGRVEPSQVGAGDRTAPQRRQRPPCTQRLQLRQPLHRRRAACCAHHERGGTRQGGPARSWLPPVLLPAIQRSPHVQLHHRRSASRTPRHPRPGPPRGATESESKLDVRVLAGLHDDREPGRLRRRRAERHGRGA